MLLNNYITLVIIRKKDKRIKLYLVLAWFLAALFFLFLGFTLFIYYQYYKNSSGNATSYQELQNNFLKQTVYYKEIQDTLDNYSEELEKIGEFDEKIRNIADQNRTSRQRKKETENFEISENSDFTTLQNSELQAKIGIQERNIVIQVKNIELNYRLRHASLFRLENIIRDNLERLIRSPSIKPLRGGVFTSSFGIRNDPFTGALQFHEGVDWSVPLYSPVIAPADGVVVYTYFENSYGNIMAINHGYGIVTRYAHLVQFEAKPGQRVKRGDTIGRTGNTGRSTGSHLHYEVIVNGKNVDPLDYVIE